MCLSARTFQRVSLDAGSKRCLVSTATCADAEPPRGKELANAGAERSDVHVVEVRRGDSPGVRSERREAHVELEAPIEEVLGPAAHVGEVVEARGARDRQEALLREGPGATGMPA